MKLILILIPLLLVSVESKVKVVKKPTPTTRGPTKPGPTTLKPISPYCQPKLCQSGQEHVACEKFSSLTAKGSNRSCKASQVQVVGMSGLKDTILKLHNERRFRLANGTDSRLPQATRMVAMQWSKELATLAGFNVRMCEPKHDDCRSTKAFPRSGQNIFVYNATRIVNKKGMDKLYTQLLTNAVKAWWSQSTNMTVPEMKLYPCDLKRQKKLRHFATMAVEGNSHVGCTGVRYVVRNMTQFKLTCNYAQSPVCWKPIYTFRGCETGRNKKFKALCSPSETF